MRLYITLFLLTPFLLQAQSNIWDNLSISGQKMNFSRSSPTIQPVLDIASDFVSAFISDDTGSVLFYVRSNGDRSVIYTSNYERMPNGILKVDNLDLDRVNEILIVPQPENSSRYYVFLTSGQTFSANSLHYLVVDMSLNGGLGDVVAEKKYKIVKDGLSRLIAGVQHENGRDFWVVVRSGTEALCYSYLISSGGISEPVVSHVDVQGGFNSFTSLRFNKLGTQAATTVGNYGVALLNFDKENGVLSDESIYNFSSFFSGVSFLYNVEFSPSGEYLYVLGNTRISLGRFMFKLNSQLFQLKIGEVDFSPLVIYKNTNDEGLTNLKLCPNDKLYVTNFKNYLSVINYPDKKGMEAGFVFDSRINFNGKNITYDKFQNTIHIYSEMKIISHNDCSGLECTFETTANTNIQTYVWQFGDTYTSTEAHPTHTYTSPGEYTVTLQATYPDAHQETVTKEITIYQTPKKPIIIQDQQLIIH